MVKPHHTSTPGDPVKKNLCSSLLASAVALLLASRLAACAELPNLAPAGAPIFAVGDAGPPPPPPDDPDSRPSPTLPLPPPAGVVASR
jgi:hypothetical protein